MRVVNPPVNQVASWFTPSDKIVILTGAGISAESGVPTFRDKDTGLWSRFNPAQLANFESFLNDPKLVWEWYDFRKQNIHSIQPNPGHFALVEMESMFNQFTLVTQNIDNLHQRAGSKNVIELHGNIERNYCIDCKHPKSDIVELPPKCDKCGGLVRPDVVWFGEMLPERAINLAFQKAFESTIFLVIGTSAEVYPAAQIPIDAARTGAKVIIVNPDDTAITPIAYTQVYEKSGTYLPQLIESIKVKWQE